MIDKKLELQTQLNVILWTLDNAHYILSDL